MKINLCFLYLVLGFSLLFSCGPKKEHVDNTDEKVSEKKEGLAPAAEEIFGNQIIDIGRDTAMIIARSFNSLVSDIEESSDTITQCILIRKSNLISILNEIPGNGFLGIYLGHYKLNDTVRAYLSSRNNATVNYTRYLGQFTIILAQVNSNLQVQNTLLNLGGLCPPDCGDPNHPDNVRNYLR